MTEITETPATSLPPGVNLVLPPARPFLVLETRATLILDWDIETEVTLPPLPVETAPTLTEATPDLNTESGCCTISCVQDAVKRLVAYSSLCQDQLWAVYETGKGVRALRLDKDFPTDHVSLSSLQLALNPDHKYMASSVERKHWAARVSHKEGRPNEEIRFLQWVGRGAAMAHQWAVLKLHHELLLEHKLTTVPFNELVEALEAHLEVPKENYSSYWTRGYRHF